MQKISIIIEWENVLLSEMDRCRLMLKELRRQIFEFNSQMPAASEFEIRVTFNQEFVRPEIVKNEMIQVFQQGDPHIEWHLTPTTGLNYYDLKNFGARQTDGDIILFLDSDVIPEAGWLKNLMGSFDDPGVEVVGGNAFLDLSNLMGRAMALTWVFPPRAQQSVLKGYNFFYANNVAFRKSVSARFPFPKMQEGATRGSCLQLAENLKQNGIKIYRHTGAQVSHPPPNGWRHFIIRGIAEGRDELLLTRVGKGKKWFGREIFRVVRRFVLGVSAGFRSIGRQGKTVNISRREMPLVFGIVFIYWQCRLFGAFATRLVPQFMRNHFRI